jgi:hypothetical protein
MREPLDKFPIKWSVPHSFCSLLSLYPHWRKVHRSIRTTSAVVVLHSTNSSAVGNFKLYDYSHDFTNAFCCSTVFTNLTSQLSPVSLVILRAKQTYVCDDYRCCVSLQCYETDTEVLWRPLRTTVLQQNVLLKSLDKHTIWNYLQYYYLLNLTLQWHWQFGWNVILLVQVLELWVWNFWRWSVLRMRSFDVTPCSLAATASSKQTVTGIQDTVGVNKVGVSSNLYWLIHWDSRCRFY